MPPHCSSYPLHHGTSFFENILVAEQLGIKLQLKMSLRTNTGRTRPSNLKPNGPDYKVLRTLQRTLKRSARQP